MKYKGYIQMDALLVVVIISVSSLLILGFGYVKYHFRQVINFKQVEINDSFAQALFNLRECEITYVPEETMDSEMEQDDMD